MGNAFESGSEQEGLADAGEAVLRIGVAALRVAFAVGCRGPKTGRRTPATRAPHRPGSAVLRSPTIGMQGRLPVPSASQQPSPQQLVYHPSRDIGEPVVAALEAPHQPFVVEAELVQQRRVQVMHMHAAIHDVVAELVGVAVHVPRAQAAAGEPDREGALQIN